MLLNTLFAVTAEYKVTSMGLNVAAISMSVTESNIEVTTRTNPGSILFPKLDNKYMLKLGPDWLPVKYTRVIDQKNIHDTVTEDFSHSTGLGYLNRTSNGTRVKFPLHTDTRDLFSFLAYISAGNFRKADYHIDSNGSQWLASVVPNKHEIIQTKLGKIKCTRLELNFTPLSPNKTAYVDMVTFNFVNKDTNTTLWIGNHGVPLRAVVDRKGKKMKWEISKLNI